VSENFHDISGEDLTIADAFRCLGVQLFFKESKAYWGGDKSPSLVSNYTANR